VSRSDPDALLAAQVAAGDHQAFRRLIAKHTPAVLRTALRYTGNLPDAEDICQEVFLQVWRKAGGFRGRSSFSTWLYRIVVNRCLNHREKRRREPLSLDRLLAGERPEEGRMGGGSLPGAQAGAGAVPVGAGAEDADPAAASEKAETLRMVGEALRALPGRQRAALILVQLEGRSYREVAEILDTTVPAVESLLFRARARLRRRLASRLEGEI
jgi:RNA polymerase sigma-70 factor (ECF subfamily)